MYLSRYKKSGFEEAENIIRRKWLPWKLETESHGNWISQSLGLKYLKSYTKFEAIQYYILVVECVFPTFGSTCLVALYHPDSEPVCVFGIYQDSEGATGSPYWVLPTSTDYVSGFCSGFCCGFVFVFLCVCVRCVRYAIAMCRPGARIQFSVLGLIWRLLKLFLSSAYRLILNSSVSHTQLSHL